MRQGDILAGRYLLMEQIGQGGTGIIYKAYDRNLEKYVVIKKIKDQYAGRLKDRIEVDILKRLHHAYLPQVYDFLSVGQQVFTVMDFVDGWDLKWYIDHGYALEEGQLRKWLEQLLEVLKYLHGQKPKIIHGDIKPANIMITSAGDVCLIDFNISLGDGDLAAVYGVSEAYGAPEQVLKAAFARQGRPHQRILLDERTDLYSLGKSFYVQMEYGRQKGIEYSGALWDIVKKAMKEEPDERYPSAEKMLRAVKNLARADRKERRYFGISVLIHGGYALCLILSALLVFFGIRLNQKEDFRSAYQALQTVTEAEAPEEMVDQGLELLNMQEFERQKTKIPKEAAAVFHAVGDGYYMQGKYEAAAEYYEYAAEVMKGAGQEVEEAYYLDYGIALARAGKTGQAEKVAREAEAEGTGPAYLELIEGEILLSKGEADDAKEVFEAAADRGGETKVQACIQLADIYEQEGDTASAAEWMEEASRQSTAPSVTRRMGMLYHAQGRNEEAAECFRSLLEVLQPAYEDWINYAVCCESKGDYSQGMEGLLEAAKDQPDRYEAYMHLAFASYKTGRKAAAEEYYKQAEERYDEEGTKDPMMEELDKILG